MKKYIKALAALLVLLCLTALFASCSKKGGDTVLKINGKSVSYEEYRYFYMNTKSDAETEEGLLDKVASNIKNAYSVYEMAKKYKVSLSSDELDEIDAYAAEIKASYGDDNKYYDELEKSYLSDYTLVKTLELQQLKSKLFTELTAELYGEINTDRDVVVADIKSNFYRATQIFISNDEGDDIEENRKLAESLYERAKNGEDFQEIIENEGEDGALKGNADGYYSAKGQRITEFESTALSLDIGEISNVVESSLGFHIVKRLEIEDEYIDENYDDLLYVYEAKKFNDMQKPFVDGAEITYTNAFYKLDYEKMEEYKCERIISETGTSAETDKKNPDNAEN